MSFLTRLTDKSDTAGVSSVSVQLLSLDGSLAASASNAQRQQRALSSGAVLHRRALDNWSSYSPAVRFLCGISSLLHFVNLILFTLLLVHLISHHSHHLRSHHDLSLSRPFTSNLKLISFTNPFLHLVNHLDSRFLDVDRTYWALACFSFFCLFVLD